MPHPAIYQHRPHHPRLQDFRVTVADEAGFESEFELQAESRTAARREAIRLHAAERDDTPVASWARVH